MRVGGGGLLVGGGGVSARGERDLLKCTPIETFPQYFLSLIF